MVRRKKDVLDHLCGSMEFFMCGTEDFSKFRAKATGGGGATGAPSSAPPAEDEESSLSESNNNNNNNSNAKGDTTSGTKPRAKKVSIVAPPPTNDDDIGVERDPVAVSIRVASSSPRQPTYLELVSYYEKSGIYIKTIQPKSKFYATKIEEGMKIIRINGTPCPSSVKETFEYINAINEVLTLTAVVVESEYGEDDFMFREIKLDDDEGKNLQEVVEDDDDDEEETKKNAPSPTRVTTDWFSNGINGILGGKKKEGGEDEKKKAEERKERIKNTKKAAAVSTERDRIGLGFADQVLKDLGVIEQDGEDNDSLFTYDQDDTTYRSAPTLDDTTYRSAPMDDDDYTMSTAGGTTIIDSSPVIAKIYKKTKQDHLGLHFVSFKKRRGIYVYRIHEESRFLSTKLEPGMKLLEINGQACPATVAETLALVQNIEGNLSIKAHYPSPEDIMGDHVQQQELTTKTNNVRSSSSSSAPNKKGDDDDDDLTGVQVPATFGDAEKAQEEKKEEETTAEEKTEKKDADSDDSGGEETQFLVAKLEGVAKNITDAVEQQGDDKKMDDTNKNKEADDEASEYVSLPPPTNTEA